MLPSAKSRSASSNGILPFQIFDNPTIDNAAKSRRIKILKPLVLKLQLGNEKFLKIGKLCTT